MRRLPEKGPYVFTLDDLEWELYLMIKLNVPVTSKGNPDVMNALTRLRRNHLIRNEGSRSNPIWKIEPWPHEWHKTILLDD